MAQPLLLDSLEIRNFRTFRHLRVDRLGRVNLVVGKNGVGKTSLLEAIQLYSFGSNPQIVNEQLVLRDELHAPTRDWSTESANRQMAALRQLFYSRKSVDEQHEPIAIGAIGDGNRLMTIDAGWYTEEGGNNGRDDHYRLLTADEFGSLKTRIPALVTRRGAKSAAYFRLDEKPGFHFYMDIVNCQFARSSGLHNEDINILWDQISLTEYEEDVLKAVQIITSSVERVNLVGDPEGFERTPFVRLSGQPGPIPLRSLGEGMGRLFGLALALVNARDGFLLIDEIENGLHYSVQPAIWRLIFEVAQRLNIQVFATTHSDDCVRAFQYASTTYSGAGLLVSLRAKKNDASDGKAGDIVAVLYNEENLAIATQEQIEVR